VFQDKSLRFYNSFNYQNEEDLIYFLLYSLEQLQLDHKENELMIYGTIEPNSSASDLLSRYFKKIHFNTAAEHRSITEAIGVPPHFYFSLLKQHLCA
jgi:hypothetical protein